MAYKSILTILTEPKEVAPVLDAAVAFAEASQADLEVLCLGIDRTQTGYYFAGATALMHEETILQAQSEAQAIEAEARQFLARSAISPGESKAWWHSRPRSRGWWHAARALPIW